MVTRWPACATIASVNSLSACKSFSRIQSTLSSILLRVSLLAKRFCRAWKDKMSRTKGTCLFDAYIRPRLEYIAEEEEEEGRINWRDRVSSGGYRPYFISGIYLPNARWYSAFHRIKEPRKRFLLGISVIPLPKIDEPILTGSFLLLLLLVPFLPTNILLPL